MMAFLIQYHYVGPKAHAALWHSSVVDQKNNWTSWYYIGAVAMDRARFQEFLNLYGVLPAEGTGAPVRFIDYLGELPPTETPPMLVSPGPQTEGSA